jgi:hypothetical protein
MPDLCVIPNWSDPMPRQDDGNGDPGTRYTFAILDRAPEPASILHKHQCIGECSETAVPSRAEIQLASRQCHFVERITNMQ